MRGKLFVLAVPFGQRVVPLWVGGVMEERRVSVGWTGCDGLVLGYF